MEVGKEMLQETEKSEQLKEICNIVSEALKTQHEITINSEELISCIKKHNGRNGYTFGEVCKDTKTVNILGTEYTILYCKENEHELLNGKYRDGCTDNSTKEIIICEKKDDCELQDYESWKKVTLRHELFHAFLFESGLDSCSNGVAGAWATNEEMIDWLAIQSPKIFKVFQELDIL